MLEWRLLVAWRVDGWHIDILFSGSVQSAASKHGQTVKRSLATVPSRGPTDHTRRAYRARTRRSPRRQRRGSEAIPDPSVRPVWVESWASAGRLLEGPWLFSATPDCWMGRREARLCAGPCPALERASERRQDRPHRLQHHAQTHRVDARRQFVVTLLCTAVGARRSLESAPPAK